MYEKIRQVVLDSGLWDQGRERSHGFVLSSSVYEVSQEKRDELEAIGMALHDCLAGLGRIAAIACNPKLGHAATWKISAWGMIIRALHTGVPLIYRDISLLHPSRVSSICKVDMMESQDGTYKIAEIDGHNKHGLGYSTLTAKIRRIILPEAKAFPGVAATLAHEVKQRGQRSLVLLFADQERFYVPEFRILQNELTMYGIDLTLVAESDVRVNDEKVIVNGNEIEQKTFIDFPFLYHNPTLNAWLAAHYRTQEIDFLIPPKPFLGSKVILALLRNDINNKELEAILKSQINLTSLDLMRQYIPETYLVHKGNHSRARERLKEEYWRSLCNNKRFVLKESISSGMKGVVFTDDQHFNAIMKQACDSYYRFILQEEVTNRARTFQYFANGNYLGQGEWFMRITVHYAVRRVADIVVTARQDKKVHGARDCLQLGAIIV